MNEHTQRLTRVIILLLVAISALLSALWLGRGFSKLGFLERPGDLFLRWREQIYVCNGQDPYVLSEYMYANMHGQTPDIPVGKQVIIDPVLGATATGSGYPPWAFFWANLFIPPVAWQISRIWFLFSNLAACAFMAYFAWRSCPSSSTMERLLLVFGLFSSSAIGTTLGNGQWGIVLSALLCASLSLKGGKGTSLVSALAYSIALLKPSFSFAHIAVFLKQRQWMAIFVIGVATIIASLLIGLHVQSSPLEMVTQMISQTSRWEDISYSIPDALTTIGIPRSMSMLGCLTAGVVLSFLCLNLGPDDAVFKMAVCTGLARLLSYHQLYDNLMISFLALALGRLFLRQRTMVNGLIYVCIMILIWLPGRMSDLLPIQIIQITLWSVGIIWLVYSEKKLMAAPSAENSKC